MRVENEICSKMYSIAIGGLLEIEVNDLSIIRFCIKMIYYSACCTGEEDIKSTFHMQRRVPRAARNASKNETSVNFYGTRLTMTDARNG